MISAFLSIVRASTPDGRCDGLICDDGRSNWYVGAGYPPDCCSSRSYLTWGVAAIAIE